MSQSLASETEAPWPQRTGACKKEKKAVQVLSMNPAAGNRCTITQSLHGDDHKSITQSHNHKQHKISTKSQRHTVKTRSHSSTQVHNTSTESPHNHAITQSFKHAVTAHNYTSLEGSFPLEYDSLITPFLISAVTSATGTDKRVKRE